MNRLLIVLLLAGCAQQEQPAAPVTHTTIYRYTSQSCPPPDADQLKRVTASRDEWKRYARSLEKLLPANTSHGTHP